MSVFTHMQLSPVSLDSVVLSGVFVRAGVNTATTVGRRPKRRPLEKRAGGLSGGHNPNFILS